MIYDKIAKKYDRLLAPLEKIFLSKWRLEALSNLPENAVILEIGAGTGLNFRFYPKSRITVACEISSEMLIEAKEKGFPYLLVQADAESLPFANDSFDAGLATLVFCSISNPLNALNELRRVIKKDGKLILLEHVRPKGFLGYLFDFINIFTQKFLNDCFNRETSKIVNESGFEIIELSSRAGDIFNLIICINRKN